MHKNPSTVVTDLCTEAARQLQSTTAGGGKSLIIARLPQCQVHPPLPHPTPSPPNLKPALARLAAQDDIKKREGGKKTGSDLLAHTVYSKSVSSVSCAAENDQAAVGLARGRGRGREKGGRKVKNMQPNRVYTYTETFFTFQSTLETLKQLRKENRRGMNTFPEAREKIMETYWSR